MVEQIIEVDENDNQIGLRPKDDFYTGKYIHRWSHLILCNSKNEILLQQRAATKKWYPNLFTYSVSWTVANESYENCIATEMQEEIGITIPVERLFTYPFFDTYDKAWHCIFIGISDKTIQLDTREIQKVVWMNADALRKDIIEHPDIYTPPFIEGMKKYFTEFYMTEK